MKVVEPRNVTKWTPVGMPHDASVSFGPTFAKLSIVKSLDAEDVGDYVPTEILRPKQNHGTTATLKVAVDTTQEGHLRLGVRGRRGHVVPIPDAMWSRPVAQSSKAVDFMRQVNQNSSPEKSWRMGQTQTTQPWACGMYICSGPKPEVQLCFVKYSPCTVMWPMQSCVSVLRLFR